LSVIVVVEATFVETRLHLWTPLIQSWLNPICGLCVVSFEIPKLNINILYWHKFVVFVFGVESNWVGSS